MAQKLIAIPLIIKSGGRYCSSLLDFAKIILAWYNIAVPFEMISYLGTVIANHCQFASCFLT